MPGLPQVPFNLRTTTTRNRALEHLRRRYILGQHLRPMLAPFVDAGRVFDGTQLRFDGWLADGGIGLRVIWNLVTAVSFDYGLSSEGQIFFMNLGYAF